MSIKSGEFVCFSTNFEISVETVQNHNLEIDLYNFQNQDL